MSCETREAQTCGGWFANLMESEREGRRGFW
ncbi:MAG: hypothetical protein AW07_00882 [Candidatus Accumulibacter sp. SK-11]|nr:MAG: hypothetical protein AW07_00882 [Candidatus Accumulibacter sp. SK-11]